MEFILKFNSVEEFRQFVNILRDKEDEEIKEDIDKLANSTSQLDNAIEKSKES